MEHETTHQPIERLQCERPILWLGAIALFGVGDVLTTGIGLGLEGIREAGPLTSVVIERYGLFSMVVTKAGILCGGYALWRVAPRPSRVGIPLGLTVLGIVVIGWNLSVIALVI
jgi:hypothetical protein